MRQFISSAKAKAKSAAVALAIVVVAAAAQATTILSVDFQEVVAKSQLVFQGEALRQEVRTAQGQQMTFVTFRVDEVVKGAHSGETLELGFLGGGNSAVAGLTIPPVGEYGIYFVESTTGLYVNPLYGWHQGHYIVETDAQGRRTIRRSDATAAVYNPVTHAISEPGEGAGGAAGAAAGASGAAEGGAETLAAFKQRVRSIAGAAASEGEGQ